jgi:hypothetical protein
VPTTIVGYNRRGIPEWVLGVVESDVEVLVTVESTATRAFATTVGRWLRRRIGYRSMCVICRVSGGRRGNSTRKFGAVDSYVDQRLARLASTTGSEAINWGRRFDHRWLQSLGVHRLTATVGPWGAHACR